MNDPINFWLCCLSAALTVVGCNSADEPIVEATPAVAATPAAAEKPALKPVANPPKSPDAAAAPTPSQPIAQFTPPFPDRLELFEPPKRAQGTVRRDDAGETVELKGFINVDEPKVLLAIDGVIAPIPEGGEKYGVQVISIEPPSVYLQRGRNRWKATLE
jgi:hypothetical protein